MEIHRRPEEPDIVIECANFVQDTVIYDVNPWPPCPTHQQHPLIPQKIGPEGYWVCPLDDTVRTEIGSLGS